MSNPFLQSMRNVPSIAPLVQAQPQLNVSEATKGILGGGDPIEEEMRKLSSRKMNYDNKTPLEITRSAATKMGISPALLYSSAFQEGMNKAIAKPDEVSEAYLNAQAAGLDTKAFPVDGFYNYGLDRFGDNLERLKKYLPKGFETRFKTYQAKNEKGENINTAAFITNEDAMVAKAAILKDTADQVQSYAKKKGIQLDEEAANYFTLAGYNGGFGNAKMMLDEYASAKDKKEFISKGLTTRGGVHKNISPRMARMLVASELFNPTNTE